MFLAQVVRLGTGALLSADVIKNNSYGKITVQVF